MPTQTLWIDLSLIDLPVDARAHDPNELESLARDMAANEQIQEIVVAPKEEGHYEVIAGVGRTLAARKLGWDKIRCSVRDGLSPFDKLHLTFSENEERENASPIYQAQLLKRMLEAGKLTQDELAKKVAKDKTVISRYLSLLDLDPLVQEKLHACNLTLRQALELKRLPNKDLQLQVADECVRNDLSGKALKDRVDELLSKASKGVKKEKKAASPAQQFFQKNGMSFKAEGPRVVISAASFDRTQDNLDSFLTRLKGAILLWCSQHPYQVTGQPTAGNTETTGDSKTAGQPETPVKVSPVVPISPDAAVHSPAPDVPAISCTLPAPVLDKPQLSSDRRIHLQWSPAADARAYQLLYGKSPDALNPLPGGYDILRETKHIVKASESSGNEFYFAVRALNAQSLPGPLSEVVKVLLLG